MLLNLSVDTLVEGVALSDQLMLSLLSHPEVSAMDLLQDSHLHVPLGVAWQVVVLPSSLYIYVNIAQIRHVHEILKKLFFTNFVSFFTSFSFLKVKKTITSFSYRIRNLYYIYLVSLVLIFNHIISINSTKSKTLNSRSKQATNSSALKWKKYCVHPYPELLNNQTEAS